MRTVVQIILIAFATSAAVARAQAETWQTFTIPETGTSVEYPSSIFTEQAGRPADGYGQRFRSADGRADLTIQAAAIPPNVSPGVFLAKMHPPQRIQYKRITSRFFAVSSYKRDKVWYDRCNFANGFVYCVLLNYPAKEEHAWDSVVTRISLSLNDRQARNRP